jgi:23S rRNA (adenine2030-N6)-methyltransferase
MNYRHAFHAGNFADLFKHALLLHLLETRAAAAEALTVIDTHAGAGVYDLAGATALKTGEGSAALALMAAEDAPAPLQRLQAAVRGLNGSGQTRLYPGSPWLIATRLRSQDVAIACERRADDAGALRRAMTAWPRLEVLQGDGWDLAARRAPRAPVSLMALIDPPYEDAEDAPQVATLVGRLLRINRGARLVVWAPIKDLAGFDALAARVEDAAAPSPVLIAEARLRGLDDPLRLNGCACLVVNPPQGFEAAALEAGRWIAERFGGEGGAGRVRRVR